MQNHIDTYLLNNFLVVADTLSFTKAAEIINIVQPALSRQILLLEDQLGFKLFERHNRKVELTKAGKQFKMDCQRWLLQFESIKDYAAMIAQNKAGHIKIGHSSSAMHSIVPSILKHMKKTLPSMKVTLSEESNITIVEKLLNHEIDFGIGPNLIPPIEIEEVTMYKENFALVLPQNHPLTKIKFKNLKQVSKENFIIPPLKMGLGYVESILAMCHENGFVPNVLHESANSASVLRLVEAGMGVTIEPLSITKGYNIKIKAIELTKSKINVEMKLLYNKARKNELCDLMHELSTFKI